MNVKGGDVWRYFLSSFGDALSEDAVLWSSLRWAISDTLEWRRLMRQPAPAESPPQYIRFSDYDVIVQTADGNIVVDELPSSPPPYARARITAQPDMAAREKWGGDADA